MMQDFAACAKKRMTGESDLEEASVEKKPRTEEKPELDKKCCVCTDTAIHYAFVSCGHRMTCMQAKLAML